MRTVKSLAARFYRLKSGHAPTGVYLKRFGHRDDNDCWWCGRTRRPDAGAPLPPLQQMERPAEDTLEDSGTDNRLESGQMPARPDLGAFHHRGVRPGSAGLFGGHGGREISTHMTELYGAV